MMVVPLWGLYANMIAQLTSQITSHVIIYYHRRIVTKGVDRFKHNSLPHDVTAPAEARARPQYRDPEALDNKMQSHLNDIRQEQSQSSASLEDVPVEQSPSMSIGGASFTEAKAAREEETSLSTYQFSRPHRGETEKLVVRSYVKYLLPFCALSLLICVVVGCALPSFSLEFFGLVGVAVEFGQDFEEATISHSVFSVIILLFDQASYLGTLKDYLGLIILSIIFVSTILLVPIIQSVTLLRQYYKKTTTTQKRKIAVRLEILQAWQYLEVYLIALFVSSWYVIFDPIFLIRPAEYAFDLSTHFLLLLVFPHRQLGPISDFMINAYCNNLEDMFAQMVYYGVLKEEDAQCFSVTSRIEKSVFILAASAILLAFLNSFVCKAIVQYLRDEAEGKDDLNSSFSDGTSHSDDDEETVDTGAAMNIHPVPVLFTDSFRWMLKASNGIASSARTLFVDDPDDSHWSLPEATVVDDEVDGRIMKGTFVSNLGSDERIKSESMGGSPRQSRQGSIGSLSPNSCNSFRSSARGRRLAYDDDTDKKQHNKSPPRGNILKSEKRESTSSLGQQSIDSMMDSVGSSSKSRHYGMSDTDSLAYSIATRSSVPHPPSEERSFTASPGSSRKAPPPTAYRLSRASLKEPPPSHYTEQSQENLKKPPPSSSSPPRSPRSPRSTSREEDYQHISVNNGYSNEESSTVKSINDIIEEVDSDADSYFFGDENRSQQSNSHRHFM